MSVFEQMAMLQAEEEKGADEEKKKRDLDEKKENWLWFVAQFGMTAYLEEIKNTVVEFTTPTPYQVRIGNDTLDVPIQR